MFRFRQVARDHRVDGGVTVTYAMSGLVGAGSFAGGGFSYLRPVSVRLSDGGTVIPVRDHVMVLRLALLAIVLAAHVWKRSR